MSSFSDKFHLTLTEFLDLLAELLNDLYEEDLSKQGGGAVEFISLAVKSMKKEAVVEKFIDSYENWKDVYKKDPKLLKKNISEILNLGKGFECLCTPVQVYLDNPKNGVIDDDVIEDLFVFIICLCKHATNYLAERRKKDVDFHSRLPLEEICKNFKL